MVDNIFCELVGENFLQQFVFGDNFLLLVQITSGRRLGLVFGQLSRTHRERPLLVGNFHHWSSLGKIF